MVSSWTENSPTATTHRCTGSGSPPSRQEIRRPGFAEESVRVVESRGPRHGSDTERHSRRAVLGSPGLSPRDAPHHHDSIITAGASHHSWGRHGHFSRSRPSHITTAQGKGTATFSRCPPPHHTSPRLGGGETHRRRYASPDPSTAPFSAATCRRAAQHLSNELAEHSRAPQPTADEQTLSTDGQIAHLAPSRCSMTAWAAAKRAIGTRNGEQET